MGEFVNTLNTKAPSISNKILIWANLITGKISISNELLSWLVYSEGFWELLSSQVDGEGVSAVVGEVTFSNLDGIVSKEVMPDELETFRLNEESENLSVEVEELLLGSNLSSSEFLFQELKELLILLNNMWHLGLSETVRWDIKALALWLVDGFEEFSGVGITVSHSDRSAADSDIEADSEVGWLEWHGGAVLLDDHLSVEEGSLWGSTVGLLWLGDHDRSVFEEVENNEFSNSEIF